jgi:hypothetical protein
MARPKRNTGNPSVQLGDTFVGNAGTDGDIGSDGDTANSDGGNDAGSIILDPAELGPGGSDSATGNNGEPGRRKRKYTKRGTATTQKVDLNGVEATLFSIHSILAAITQTEELAISQDEANQLAAAIGSVSAHYDVSASAKTMAWVHLSSTVAMVYGPRMIALYRNSQKPVMPQNVTPSTMHLDPNIINLGGAR